MLTSESSHLTYAALPNSHLTGQLVARGSHELERRERRPMRLQRLLRTLCTGIRMRHLGL